MCPRGGRNGCGVAMKRWAMRRLRRSLPQLSETRFTPFTPTRSYRGRGFSVVHYASENRHDRTKGTSWFGLLHLTQQRR